MMFSSLQKQLASIIVQCNHKGPVTLSLSCVAEASGGVPQNPIVVIHKYQSLFQENYQPQIGALDAEGSRADIKIANLADSEVSRVFTLRLLQAAERVEYVAYCFAAYPSSFDVASNQPPCQTIFTQLA